jgi:hypothetical protein
LSSGRGADLYPDRAHPAAGRNPRRPSEPSCCAPPGAGILDLYAAEPPSLPGAPARWGSRWSRRAPAKGRPGPAPCRQVTRGGGGQPGPRRGATIRRERRSPPTEQRFRSVERPDGQPPAASARNGHDQRTSCWLSMPTRRGAWTPAHAALATASCWTTPGRNARSGPASRPGVTWQELAGDQQICHRTADPTGQESRSTDPSCT